MIRAVTVDLINETQPAGVFDENKIGTTTVFAEIRSVTRREFYEAQNEGLEPELVFVLRNFADYGGQKELNYNGKRYRIIRTYVVDDSMELTVERGAKI